MKKKSTYVPIEPSKLTAEQRVVWDRFGFDKVEPETTREFTDATFRHMLALQGIPLVK